MTVKTTLSFTDRHHQFLSEKVGQGVFALTDTSGKLVQSRWTLSAETATTTLSQDGKTNLLPAGNSILLHASTTSGKQIYAGNAKTLKFGSETVHLKEFRIGARPYHIKFCP